MKPRVEVLDGLPQPDTVSQATVMAGSALAVCYGTGDNEYAAVVFRSCSALKFGGPNDEALNGHPLFCHGLKHYSIHRIYNSPWLAELEAQNSVHPMHDKTRFLEGKVHYLFALKEDTVECIVREEAGQAPMSAVFSSRTAALEHCRRAFEA